MAHSPAFARTITRHFGIPVILTTIRSIVTSAAMGVAQVPVTDRFREEKQNESTISRWGRTALCQIFRSTASQWWRCLNNRLIGIYLLLKQLRRAKRRRRVRRRSWQVLFHLPSSLRSLKQAIELSLPRSKPINTAPKGKSLSTKPPQETYNQH